MSRIVVAPEQNAGGVFHMLSVARCGYDNDYGTQYRAMHPAKDLALLHHHASLLTVQGGAYCGHLYGLLVCRAAAGTMPARDYYHALAALMRGESSPLPDTLREGYKAYCDIVPPLTDALCRGVSRYLENVWAADKALLTPYAEKVQALFDGADFVHQAEAAVGAVLPDTFHALLVASVAYGAEAIDISPSRDVFGIDRPPEGAFFFIAHEYIIYLLKIALKETDAFQNFSTWNVTEGMAEYYLRRIMGKTIYFDQQRPVAEYCAAHPGTAAEMYHRAVAAFNR